MAGMNYTQRLVHGCAASNSNTVCFTADSTWSWYLHPLDPCTALVLQEEVWASPRRLAHSSCCGLLLLKKHVPALPVDAGDVCLLFTTARQPYKSLTNISACACYQQCGSEEACGWRKFCPAARKRWVCQAEPLVTDGDQNSCPRWVVLQLHSCTLVPPKVLLPGTSRSSTASS